MVKKIVMVSGSSASGKTLLIKRLVPFLKRDFLMPAVCKIDCLHSDDLAVFKTLGVPAVLGLSEDICPDHYLVSNLDEIITWASEKDCDLLIIETAGLCNRCSPATKNSISVCVVDCACGIGAPKKLGPMLTHADIVVMTKIDTVSQAEREIFARNIKTLNATAAVVGVDGISGYGVQAVYEKIKVHSYFDSFSEDKLRHSMPAGVCSYCIGEKRIGKQYQQGVVAKIIL